MIHHTCELCGGCVKFPSRSDEARCDGCGQVHCLDYGPCVWPELSDDQKVVLRALADGRLAVTGGRILIDAARAELMAPAEAAAGPSAAFQSVIDPSVPEGEFHFVDSEGRTVGKIVTAGPAAPAAGKPA